MSYDLAVFDPTIAPRERAAFIAWFKQVVEERDEVSEMSTPAIRAWFAEMIQHYPPMNNGPFTDEDLDEEPEDDSVLTDYSVTKALVYAAFAWSQAEPALERMTELAAKHGLGLFNVSSDKSGVWLPDGKGDLELAHSD